MLDNRARHEDADLDVHEIEGGIIAQSSHSAQR